MMGSSARTSRRKHAVQSFQNATDCIGTLEPGASLFAITRGQFSMIDAVLACLDQTGPAAVSLWTWTVAEYEVECLERLRRDERLTSGRLIVDQGMRNKNASTPQAHARDLGVIRQWQGAFGGESVRYVVNHAKIATIENADWKLLLRGSMNLNFNPRFEQFDLTEGGADFDLVKQIEDELPILPDDVSQATVYQASKLGNAFSDDTLSLFSGIKRWAK